MNDKTEQAVTDEPRGTAAGGHAEIINVPGYPLMVRAVDYNTLRAQLAEAQREAVSLARSLFKRRYAQEPHYASGKIEWEPFNEPASVISQIDNMHAGVLQDNERMRRALEQIANDPANAVTYFEDKWREIAKQAIQPNN